MIYLTNIATPYKVQQIKNWNNDQQNPISVWYLNDSKGDGLWLNSDSYDNEVTFPSSFLKRIGCWVRFIRALRNEHLLIGGYYSASHWCALFFGKIFARSVTLVFDGINPKKSIAKTGLRKWLKSLFIYRCNAIFANGTVSRDFFSKYFGFPQTRIFNQTLFSSPLGITTSPLPVDRRDEIRKSLGFKGYVIGYCGRLVERKRVDDLIHAFQSMDCKSNCMLAILGDGPERTSLESLASGSLGDNINFLGSRSDRKELFEILGSFDLLVLPSEDEPWGLVVNEALSMGTPVIVSDQCGCSLDLEGVASAKIFPARDVVGLTKLLHQSTTQPLPDRIQVIADSLKINDSNQSSTEHLRLIECLEGKGPSQVLIYQPDIPEYRVPFFKKIEEKGVALQLVSGMPRFWPLSILPSKIRWGFLIWQTGLSLSIRYHWDAIVLWGNSRAISSHLILLICRIRGIPCIWWGHWHSAGAPTWRTQIKQWLQRIISIRLLLYTQHEREQLLGYKFDPKRIFALNNTIDTQTCWQASSSWTRETALSYVQNLHGINRPYFLFCGRLTPKCELPLALTALKQLECQGVYFSLVIIGEGKIKSSTLRSLADSPIRNHVHFLGAIFDEQRLAPYFLGAEAFVYPGSIGLSLLHAFAYGLPVVTHSNSKNHMPEFSAMEPEQNGLVFNQGDPSSLAMALSRFVDPNFRLRLSLEAFATVDKNWSMDAMVDRFMEALDSCKREAQ
jgi:glycosyltransferase involved in cell wall biosynthesis